MTNRKNTRRALVLSLLSLLVCCSMLVGTTFAWFTDSVTSGNNQIVAGNLDVELYHSNKTVSDEKVTANTLLFDEVELWEPGVVAFENVKVANVGTLALKYQLSVNFTNATATPEGKTLADVLKVAFVKDGVDAALTREAMVASVKEWGAMKSFAQNGKLLPGQTAEETFGIVIWWEPGENDNDYNMNNGNQGIELSIDLGVNLFATQLEAEYDSFGPDYDKDAVYSDATYTVEGEGTLAATLAEVEAADDATVLIQLKKDVEWETGAGHGSTPWIGEDAAVQNLIVDANGYTIKATGKGVGAIRMANGGTLTIKNAKIVDESVSYAEDSWEFTYLELDGKLAFENCQFTSGISVDGENAEFNGCSFNSDAASEYSVWVANGNATFKNCTFTGTRGLKTHEAYGTEVGTILVDNCTFDNLSKKPGMAIGTVNADTTITIKNSDFINCQAGDQGKFIYETDTDVTTFNFDASQNNEIIKSVTPDLEIGTAAELFALANDVNVNGNSYAGKLVVLTADIDLENAEWTPIGQTGGNGVATYFQGMFDGKGHTISNLKITDNAYDEGKNYAAGLFGFVDAGDAQIVNLTVDGANVSAHHWTGVIAGYLTGKINNCTVKNATVVCEHANNDACGDKAGAVVGYVNTGLVSNCTVQDATVTAGRDAGQVAGCAKADYVDVDSCTAINVTVSATGDCTGANINNSIIGRLN